MALTVETGAGLANADALISVADAATYLTAVGDTTWVSASTAAKEAALRRATQYLDTQYTWRGVQLTSTQALEWPRSIDIGDGRAYTWPVRQIREACAELAVRALAGDLYADAGQTIKSEAIGPIRTEYEPGLSGGQTRFVAVDRMVAKFTTSGGAGRSSMRIERVQ